MSLLREVTGVVSRAVDDDSDYEEESEEHNFNIERSTLLRWSTSFRSKHLSKENKKLPCRLLLIAVGPAATGFASSCIFDLERVDTVGVLCSGFSDADSNTFSQKSISDKSCFVYAQPSKPDTLFVQCNISIIAEEAFSWVEQLFEELEHNQLSVIILTSIPVIEYKSEVIPSDLEMPFLRCLTTRAFSGKPACPFLEQPNLITGLPAQLLTYCQTRGVAAVLYSSYTNVRVPDKETIKSFLPVINLPLLKDIVVKREPKDREKLFTAIVRAYQDDNTLYL